MLYTNHSMSKKSNIHQKRFIKLHSDIFKRNNLKWVNITLIKTDIQN